MEKPQATTFGELKQTTQRLPGVREEMRTNLMRMIQANQPLFPGMKGYHNTVIPQVINALLCGHNLIILGERGQGKTRLIRSLVHFLDEYIPAVADCPLHDNPFAPVCTQCRARLLQEGDSLPVVWVPRDHRLVEKLATSDVSTADLVGEVDPIRIAEGRTLDDETAIHFGLVPRANRGIFAINELPDIAEKIQVALFNIMEERDLQIKGFPVRLPLDVLVVATANPEDYTSRGRIITPLKDRFDAQIRTHYPAQRSVEIQIMEQESRLGPFDGLEVHVPPFMKNILAEITLQARSSPDISQHSGVSCRATIRSYEAIMGRALQRCLELDEKKLVPRITDIEAVFPAVAGKLELEYGGQERKDSEIMQDLSRRAIKVVFDEYFNLEALSTIIESFNNGIGAEVSAHLPSEDYLDGLQTVPGLRDAVSSVANAADHFEVASAIEFILEGLHLSNKLNRDEVEGVRTYKQT